MTLKESVLLAAVLIPLGLTHAGPSTGPAIANYGPVFDIPGAGFALQPARPWKVLFDIAASPEDRTALNRRIESIARYINMHVRSGVPLEQMQITAVLHGSASKDALSDSAYIKRFGHKNPNTELIRALQLAGVSFWLCGQSAGFGNIEPEELAAPVGLALSAMTVTAQLQAEGYSLLP